MLKNSPANTVGNVTVLSLNHSVILKYLYSIKPLQCLHHTAFRIWSKSLRHEVFKEESITAACTHVCQTVLTHINSNSPITASVLSQLPRLSLSAAQVDFLSWCSFGRSTAPLLLHVLKWTADACHGKAQLTGSDSLCVVKWGYTESLTRFLSS